MRVPLDWLHEYVDSRLDASATADTLTMLGLEVEEVEDEGASGSPVLNVTVMSNRGDCLSMIGVARELAADEDLPVKLPSFQLRDEGPPAAEAATIEIHDPDLCYRYAGTIIKDVKIGDSPDWMAKRLIAAGMRPINSVVDVTNYVMLETGQPLHAFDYDLLQDHAIVVRRARPGETITTIDGGQRQLAPEMLAICDRSRPVAVAGVMGGAETEVTAGTTNVLIESACFNGASVRKTARSLGLPTEASYRFERGVDLGGTANAAKRAAEMIREIAGGLICQGVVDEVARKPETRTLTVRAQRASAILGVELNAEECAAYLRRLSFGAEASGGQVSVETPTWRTDIAEEIDLIEEIGRLHGFDNLPATLITGPSIQGRDSEQGVHQSAIRQILAGCGLQEVVTHSIVAKDTTGPDGTRQVSLRNVLSEDVAEMRRSLLPGLVQVLGLNFSRDIRDLGVFEIGKVFFHDGIPGEKQSVAVCMTGSRWDGLWALPDKKLQPAAYRQALFADFYQAKGVAQTLLERMGTREICFRAGHDGLWREGYAAEIMVGGERIGYVGEVSETLRESCNLKAAAFGFELDAGWLMSQTGAHQRWQAPSRFPAVKRDLAVVVNDQTEYGDVAAVVEGASRGLLEELTLFDVYRGEQIAAGKKSLAFSLSFRSRGKTLTEDDVSGIMTAIRERLERELNASLRGA